MHFVSTAALITQQEINKNWCCMALNFISFAHSLWIEFNWRCHLRSGLCIDIIFIRKAWKVNKINLQRVVLHHCRLSYRHVLVKFISFDFLRVQLSLLLWLLRNICCILLFWLLKFKHVPIYSTISLTTINCALGGYDPFSFVCSFNYICKADFCFLSLKNLRKSMPLWRSRKSKTLRSLISFTLICSLNHCSKTVWIIRTLK